MNVADRSPMIATFVASVATTTAAATSCRIIAARHAFALPALVRRPCKIGGFPLCPGPPTGCRALQQSELTTTPVGGRDHFSIAALRPADSSIRFLRDRIPLRRRPRPCRDLVETSGL